MYTILHTVSEHTTPQTVRWMRYNSRRPHHAPISQEHYADALMDTDSTKQIKIRKKTCIFFYFSSVCVHESLTVLFLAEGRRTWPDVHAETFFFLLIVIVNYLSGYNILHVGWSFCAVGIWLADWITTSVPVKVTSEYICLLQVSEVHTGSIKDP